MTKAYLIKNKIFTNAPEEHKNTYEEFKKLCDIGLIDYELIKIYKEIIVKADTLLNIFDKEKHKRGKFTYNILSEINMRPANESLENASYFIKHINSLL